MSVLADKIEQFILHKLLEEDNIKKISFKDNQNIDNHTKLLINFFQ